MKEQCCRYCRYEWVFAGQMIAAGGDDRVAYLGRWGDGPERVRWEVVVAYGVHKEELTRLGDGRIVDFCPECGESVSGRRAGDYAALPMILTRDDGLQLAGRHEGGECVLIGYYRGAEKPGEQELARAREELERRRAAAWEDC